VRVLQVCVRYPPALGGVEAHVQRLSQGLAARGHEVEVATSTLRSEFPLTHLAAAEMAGESAGPVRVHRFRAVSLPGDAHWPVLRGLGSWLARRARDFDVIHAHSYGFHHTLAAAGAARLASVPFVLTPHFHPHWSMELGPRRRHLRRAFDALAKRRLLEAPAAVVCVSRAEAALLGAHRPERVRVIPNGVDPARFEGAVQDGLRARLGVPGPMALYVGRLAANKGLPTLLEAWAKVPPEATLLVAGEGHLHAELGKQARDLGLDGRVRLLGRVDDATLLQAYAACDLFVLPSEYEAFGIVLLEAMAAGKPVVAARAGGVPEVVAEGATGLLVPVGDAPRLAEAVQALLADPVRARAMGEAGRRRVHQGFTWDAVVGQVEALYRELTPPREPSARAAASPARSGRA